MIKYFISYKNLINDNKINKKMSIYSPEFKILRKSKDGTYREEPLLYFIGYIDDLLTFIDKMENRKTNISFMVELNEEEAKQLNPLFIKEYEVIDGKKLKIINKNKKIELLNFNALVNLKPSEFNNGKLVLLEKSKKDLILSSLDETFINGNILEKRNNLKKRDIVNDIYFFTEDNLILEKYKEKTTLIEKIDEDKYKILKHKVLIIDSISQDRIMDFTSNTYRCLFELCNLSVPVYIKKEDDEYEIISNKKIDNSKKGYLLMNQNIETLVHNPSIEPLIKYINLFEFDNYKYKKISIEEYLKDKNILKYIKKPSKN